MTEDQYIQLLERINEQISYTWNPIFFIIGALTILITVGAVIAAVIMFMLGRDYSKKINLFFREKTREREREMVNVENWNIPELLPYGREYSAVSVKKSIMQPFFSDEKWKPETAFINFLEGSEKVEWWFKNGDRDATFFAVRYDNGEEKPFYVDFVVKLKDGQVGLFDTKAGLTKKVAGPKIDGLYKYIQSESKKGKKCFGGIVANTERNYRGRWVYFDKASKEFKDSSFDNWTDLIL